jgi:uracil-DNA glycosylase
VGAEDYLPPDRDIDRLRDAADRCRGCRLYQDATQTVFGEGDPRSALVLVGEQPGDVEDRTGEPFVGPAGTLLFRCLGELGVAREDVYITNAVKHFTFTQRGKRRIHQKPSLSDLVACKPWLDAELETLQPQVLVCLGATAIRSVLGPGHSVTKERGALQPSAYGGQVLVTTHPSAVLRAPDRTAAYAGLKADLEVAVSAVRQSARR